MVDYNGAVWSPNNNYFSNTGKKSFIILHGTAGGSSAESIAKYFRSTEGGGSPVSSHYIVGQDGHVIQTVAESDGAYANGVANNPNWTGNPNYYTISIEHVKSSTDNGDPLTPAQQVASFALIKDVCIRNGIEMHDADDETGITGHFSIDPVNRSRCPGTFPWEQLWAFLKDGTDMLDLNDPVVQMFFTDGGNGTWKCKKNGVILLGGNLNFYRSKGGPALFGLPLANEIYPSQYPGTAIVPCERVLIVYDPKRKIDNSSLSGPCYLLHLRGGIGEQLLMQNVNKTVQSLTDKINQIHSLSTL